MGKAKEITEEYTSILEKKIEKYSNKYNITYSQAKDILEEGWTLACEMYENQQGNIRKCFQEV